MRSMSATGSIVGDGAKRVINNAVNKGVDQATKLLNKPSKTR